MEQDDKKIKTESLNNSRSWLERNKIFFDTIAAILISVMAIVVGIAQWQVSNAQKEIADKQLNIDIKSQQPQFIFQLDVSNSGKHQTISSEILSIENVGGHALEASFNHIETIEFSLEHEDGSDESQEVEIYSYYTKRSRTGRSKGKIYVLEGHENESRTKLIMNSVSKLFEEKGWDADSEIIRYVSIRYKDVIGDSHTKYFKISNYGAKSLGDWYGEQKFLKYRSKSNRPPSIDIEYNDGDFQYIVDYFENKISE